MDFQNLAVILAGALSPNPDERKAAENSLNQVSFAYKLLKYCFVNLS